MKQTIAKIIQAKSWFFEKINKIEKTLASLGLVKKKRKKNQINKIRKENGATTTQHRNAKDHKRLQRSNSMPIK